MVKQVGPNGRALNKDGTERKARTKLTPFQKAQRRKEARKAEMRSIGRDILKADKKSNGLLTNVGKARAWLREAVAYSTPEKVAERVARLQAEIDSAQAKHETAVEYLENSADLSALEDLEANVGEDVFAFMDDNAREPTAEETAEMCAAHCTEEVSEALADAGDPENDPFTDFRRDNAEEDSEDESDDSDNL